MTKRNSPKVTTVSGMVSKTNSGLMSTLSTARTMARTKAEKKPSTSTPGKRYAAMITATALRISLKIIVLIFLLS